MIQTPGRIYTARMVRTTVSTQRTLVELTAHANRTLVILSAWISNTTSETAEQLEASIVRKSAAGTGTSFTPLVHVPGDTAFGGTCRVNCTAEGTVTDELHAEGFHNSGGWLWVPVPEERIVVTGSGIIGIRFAVAPASQDFSAGIRFAEIG
jgi:hypothetical protein